MAGKGRVIPKGEGVWELRLEFGRDANGKRLQKSKMFHGGIRAAQRELAKMEEEYKDGLGDTPERVTFGQYLDRWLDETKMHVSPRTHQGYADIVRVHLKPKLGKYLLHRVQPLQLQEYERKALASGRVDGTGGLSQQTVLHHHRLLRTAFKQAVAWRLLERSPMDGVRAPAVENEDRPILEDDGVIRLLQLAVNGRFFAPVLFTLATGLRRGELLALRWSDLDIERRRLEIRRSLEETKAGLRFKPPKTKKSRRVLYLPPILVQVLEKHRELQNQAKRQIGAAYADEDLIFAGTLGGPWVPGQFSKAYYNLRVKVGLPTTFHDLRHSIASLLLRDGVHLKVVSEFLGHSTVATTGDIYSSVTDRGKDEISEHTERALRRVLEESDSP